MIKIITILSIASFEMLSSQVNVDHNPNHQMEHRKDMRKKHVEIKKELNLSPEQTAKMKELRMKRQEEIKARKQQNKEFQKNINNRTKADIDAILTPEQKLKMDQIRADRKKEFKEHKKLQNKLPSEDRNKIVPPKEPLDAAPSILSNPQ